MIHYPASLLAALSLSLAASLLSAASPAESTVELNAAHVPVFQQPLVIEGAPVQIAIAPVYDDKAWAFTTRWDDNNRNSLNMHAAMSEIGLKGSFFLNGSRGNTASEFARQLSTNGNSVEGHTVHHYFLPTLTPNALFEEILFNRIERESDTDVPINAFAFPYGRYSDRKNKDAKEQITHAWLRSGYHHNVYTNFIVGNDSIPDGAASTINQVRPGDREINAPKFRQEMDKILSNPESYQKKSHAISVGVHPWQSPEELVKFKELLSEYTGRDDFWYCNQTELGAYFMQAANTEIAPVTGQQGHYTVTRPRADIAGNDIPLTLILNGPKPTKVQLGDEILSVQPHGNNTWLVNLPYPPSQPVPTLIDWSSNGNGFAEPHPAAKFPGLDFTLNTAPDEGWTLTLANHSDTALTDLFIALRLPLLYADGLRYRTVEEIKPGQTVTLDFERGDLWSGLRSMGLFAAAEVDFTQGDTHGRIFAVYSRKSDGGQEVGSRDAFWVAGPAAPDAISPEQLLPLSKPGAELTPLNDTPLGQWHTPSLEQRHTFARDRVVLVAPGKAWQESVKPFMRKPGYLYAVGDFYLGKEAPLHINAGLPIIFAAIDGKPVQLEKNTTPKLAAGSHRVLLILDSESKIRFYREQPVWLLLTANGERVAQPLAAPIHEAR